MIDLFATRGAIEPLLDEVARRQRAVLDSGRYILGPEVEGFEQEFANYLGRRHCVGVANGTEALTIALRAAGLEAGDEVVVPAYTFFATAEAVVNANGVPVFCDIDPETRCMTAETAAAVIGERTRALLPVHLLGNPAPMEELGELARARELVLIGDAAQAAGATLGGRPAGAWGDAAAFSFYPGKNLPAFGDGGAIATDDDEIAAKARLLRDHGSERKWVHTESGYNSRLDEIQAAALRVLLPHLDDWTRRRLDVARMYAEEGLGELVTLPAETPGAEPAFHLYAVLHPDRNRLRESLSEAGVESRTYYAPPLHQQPAMERFASGGPFPGAERVAAQNLALPMGPALAGETVATVVAAVADSLRAG